MPPKTVSFKPDNDHLSMVGQSELSGEDRCPSIHKQCKHH